MVGKLLKEKRFGVLRLRMFIHDDGTLELVYSKTSAPYWRYWRKCKDELYMKEQWFRYVVRAWIMQWFYRDG